MSGDGLSESRRRALKRIGALGTVAVAGCSGRGNQGGTNGTGGETEGGTDSQQTAETTPSMRSVKTVDAEGSASNVGYLYGVEKGAWKKQNIDLSVEIAAFGKYIRQIVTGVSDIGTMAVPPTIDFINKGEPLTFVGLQMTGVNSLLARAEDDSIRDPTDLKGKKVGLPMQNSAATRNFIALVLEEYDVDLRKDTAKTIYQPPPALYQLLEQNEIDAVGEFTGLTISGMASEKIKTIFTQNDYWRDRTGYLLPITNFVTTRGFLEDNPQLVYDFVQGWKRAKQIVIDDANQAIQQYGRLAGLTTDKEAQVAKRLTKEGVLFGSRTFLDTDLIDAQWKYLEVMRDQGQFDSLPDKNTIFTDESEIKDML